jgi:hypothetical protein
MAKGSDADASLEVESAHSCYDLDILSYDRHKHNHGYLAAAELEFSGNADLR